ncbi:FG-GAP repeat domain-containing protein [Nocardia suismassiliense]|uniref:FG-GAP repeat domain-containing protein n=1 Tax=Nocardia suismassiliense TaxID=2077092 RepID=UPI00131ED510|nr:VCBS repeat-containing protein [Nocardia suismassiliense]
MSRSGSKAALRTAVTATAVWSVCALGAVGAGPAGAIGFTPAAFFNTASGVLWDVQTADFNRDGRPDILPADALQFGWGGVSILTNQTTPGSFEPHFSVPTQLASGPVTTGAAAADFNGDGKIDVASSNTMTINTGGVSVFLNRTEDGAPQPDFTSAHSFPAGLGATQIEAGDLNGDGKSDLLIGNFLNVVSANVQVLMNTTHEGAPEVFFSGPFSFDGGFVAEGLKIADLNADGRNDVVVGQTFSSQVTVLINEAAPGAPAPVLRTHQFVVPTANSIGIADYNGDSKPDIAAAISLGTPLAGITVLDNRTPTGSMTPIFPDSLSIAPVFGTGLVPEYVATADFDGDGRPDIATANDGALKGLPGGISLLLNRTTPREPITFAPDQPMAAGTFVNAIATDDFNSDGKPDLVTGHIGTILGVDGVAVLLNIGSSA